MFGQNNQQNSMKPVCEFYQRGNCKYENNCWKFHPGAMSGNVFGGNSSLPSSSRFVSFGNGNQVPQNRGHLNFEKQVGPQMSMFEENRPSATRYGRYRVNNSAPYMGQNEQLQCGASNEPAPPARFTCPKVLVIGNNWVKHLSKYYDPNQASIDFVFGRTWDLNEIINRLPKLMRNNYSYMYVFGVLTEEFEEVELSPNYQVMRPRQSFSFAETLKKLQSLLNVAQRFNPEITLYVNIPPIVSLNSYNKKVLKSAPQDIKQQYAADSQYSSKVLFDETLKRYNEMRELKERDSEFGFKILCVADMKIFSPGNERVISAGGTHSPKFLVDGVYPSTLCAKNIMHWLLIYVRREEHKKYGKPEVDPALKKKKKKKGGKGNKKKNTFSASLSYLTNHP